MVEPVEKVEAVEDQELEKKVPEQTEQELLQLVEELKTKVTSLEELTKVKKEILPELSEQDIIDELTASTEKEKIDYSKIDIERLSNAELAGLILAEVERSFFSPVVHRVELQRVKEELKDARAKYEDFDTYKTVIHKVASNNPSLTIEDAYLLVKSKMPKKEATDKKDPKVLSLEEAAKAQLKKEIPASEKPRVSKSNTREAAPQTLSDAVNRAYSEVFKE